MSAPPDFMQQLLQGLNSSMYSPTMGLAAGLLQAGGPSRMPVSLGQALGAGLQSGQQFQQAGLQNAMQQLMLGKTGMQLNMLQNALAPDQPSALPPQPNAQAQVAPIQIPAALASASNPQAATSPAPNALMPPTPGMAQATPQAIQSQPAPVSLPDRIDPYQDPIYLRDMRIGQTLDSIQAGSGAGYLAAASQRMDYLTKQTQTLTPEQSKLLIPAGAIPGQAIKYNRTTGDWSVTGEPDWKDITYTDTTDGQTKHILWNQATNQYKGIPGVTGSMPTTTPTGSPPTPAHIPPQLIKQYPGLSDTPGIERIPAQYLPMVTKIAAGEMDYPQSAKRNPTFDANLTGWVTTVNPDWKQQNFSIYQKQMQALSSGVDAKKIDPLNTIEGHLDTYRQSMQALQNGNTQLANKLGNSVGLQLGKGPQAAVAAVKQLVSGELAKAVSGGTVGEGDREQANAVLASYNSPEQTDAVLQKIQQLIGGKLNAIRQRYAANGLGHYFDMRLNGASYKAMNDGAQTQTTSSGGLPQGWTVQVH